MRISDDLKPNLFRPLIKGAETINTIGTGLCLNIVKESLEELRSKINY